MEGGAPLYDGDGTTRPHRSAVHAEGGMARLTTECPAGDLGPTLDRQISVSPVVRPGNPAIHERHILRPGPHRSGLRGWPHATPRSFYGFRPCREFSTRARDFSAHAAQIGPQSGNWCHPPPGPLSRGRLDAATPHHTPPLVALSAFPGQAPAPCRRFQTRDSTAT